MTKDDVDAFVVDMKMLASILGHNEDVIMEKFKDIFPDPNIEAALIAMDDFAAMQAKAKQLVQWRQLQYLYIQQKMCLQKVNHHNPKVINISWPQ